MRESSATNANVTACACACDICVPDVPEGVCSLPQVARGNAQRVSDEIGSCYAGR